MIAEIDNLNMKCSRLSKLQSEKYLSKRIWSELSVNIHYIILGYLDIHDLLLIRLLNLGGFQLLSCKHLRENIPICPQSINVKLLSNLLSSKHPEHYNLKVLFVVLGIKELNFSELGFRNRLTYAGAVQLANYLENIPQLQLLNISMLLHLEYI